MHCRMFSSILGVYLLICPQCLQPSEKWWEKATPSRLYKQSKETTLLSTFRPGLQTSLWRNLNDQRPPLGSWMGVWRTEQRLSWDYGFLAKNWYKNDWTDLALTRVKVFEPHHSQNIFKHILYLSFQPVKIFGRFFPFPPHSHSSSFSSGLLQSFRVSPFFQSCFSLPIPSSPPQMSGLSEMPTRSC